jgi:hypothetical protein
MDHFTPLSSLIGGVLIGASASALLLLTGQLAGITGIAGGIVRPGQDDRSWRLLFLLGLVAGGVLLVLTGSMVAGIALFELTAAPRARPHAAEKPA